MLSDDHLLQRALRMNAYFSGFWAALMCIAADWLAIQFGLTGPRLIVPRHRRETR